MATTTEQSVRCAQCRNLERADKARYPITVEGPVCRSCYYWIVRDSDY